jgi:DNA helicase HerA-like ATPase
MISEKIHELASGNIFEDGKKEDLFVGRPFYLDYDKAQILIADAWKNRVNGIPQGSFLLAFYEGEDGIEEAILLRALRPSKLPSDNDIVSTMIEYYKEGTPIQGRAGSETKSKLDDFTRYEFSFSGLECRVLGTYYKTKNQKDEDVIEFGADLENFYSANNYKVYKASEKVLFNIVNQREGKNIAGGENESKIGSVRFSSSRRFQNLEGKVEVFISPNDFIGKRTALFGMTRTGKSNTVKKIIEATEDISSKAPFELETQLPSQEPFTEGKPSFPVGQIIFDVNGEYANANLQDEGTAIFELFSDKVVRYSVLEKPHFKVMKVNFYKQIISGFEMIKSGLKDDTSDYVKSFCSIDLSEPEGYRKDINSRDSDEKNAANLYDRKVALYKCCLYKAKFEPSSDSKKVKFYGDANTINTIIPSIKPHNWISLEEAVTWFETVFDEMDDKKKLFEDYREAKGFDYFDEDMLAMLKFLTRKNKPKASATVSGYRKLNSLNSLHTSSSSGSFEVDILKSLRTGKIVIVDLSQGDPEIQKVYSEKICRAIFQDSMNNFIKSLSNNFIQFYFEEAHNLFPKKDEKDLTDVYNRLAKEGAKLNIGMTYATQEVSSISANILKNTQNWFIAHLNNDDEMKELKKYYDFSDFTDSLLRFSSNNDKGFVRMKTYTNPFVVPVQVDRFLANRKGV